MNAISICLDCGNSLAANQVQCLCGWQKPEANARLGDRRCYYALGDRRCPLPGTMCAHPYGKGPWYCSGHWHARNSQAASEAVLNFAEKNYPQILAGHADWSQLKKLTKGK